MNFFNIIWQKIKELTQRMLGTKTIENTLNITPVISSKMADAIQLWSDMYEDNPPWLHEPDPVNKSRIVSLGLPSFIASEKARMATLEFKTEITPITETLEYDNPNYTEPTVDEFGNTFTSGEPRKLVEDRVIGSSARADFLNDAYKKSVVPRLRTQLEYAIAKGGMCIKPYVVLNSKDGEGLTQAEIKFDFIQADNFCPLAFNSDGMLTEAAFIQRKIDKDTTYTRLEHHKLEGNILTVINRAFESKNTQADNISANNNSLGKEIPLTIIPEWKSIQPITKVSGVNRLLFGYLKMPEANTVDPHSPLGVSGYSRAVKQIREADMQYSRLLWEFEAGEMAIDIDRDAIRPDVDSYGRPISVIPMLQERLFRKVDLGSDGDTYNVFAPSLRDNSYLNGLNSILKRIEDNCGLSRGTLSDPEAVSKTATEIILNKDRTYSSNKHIQDAIKDCLTDVVAVMNIYCDLYDIVEPGDYDISFEFDDSVLTDKNEELNKRLTLMQNGLMSKVEIRMWYCGETESQAVEALRKITEEQLQTAEDNMMIQTAMGNVPQYSTKKPDNVKKSNNNKTTSQTQYQKNQINNQQKQDGSK